MRNISSESFDKKYLSPIFKISVKKKFAQNYNFNTFRGYFSLRIDIMDFFLTPQSAKQ